MTNPDIVEMSMSRERLKETLSRAYDLVVAVIETENAPPDKATEIEKVRSKAEIAKAMLIVDLGFTLFSGLADAILETRDNSQSADNPNPFGPGSRHQSKVGQG